MLADGGDTARFPIIWEKSGKLDPESDLLNGKSERLQQFVDSLFYNVDFIHKTNNSLPLKTNG